MEPRKPIANVYNSSGTRKHNTLDSVDRISALPDSILGVILSLLPTKTAVATSTLSKRWEFLWRTVHNLDFSFAVFRCLKENHVEDENNKFVGFVNHVLLHHDTKVLNKFRLVWTYAPDFVLSHAFSWIKTAITKNVHEISLSLYDYNNRSFDMPMSIFSCDSLRSLWLEGRICLSSASVFFLPRIESLHLHEVIFESEQAFEKIITGCPVLNYLEIYIREDANEFGFIISSTSLRRLELNLGCGHKYLQLEASSLEHLKLYGFNIPVVFVQKKLTSLVEAKFLIDLNDKVFSQASVCNSVVDTVGVKILTLSSSVMRALSCSTRSLSSNFVRLVKLEISIKCCYWSSLQDFIQCSNNLEALTIHKYQIYPRDGNDHDHSSWTTPVEVPRWLSTSLKKVVLDGYYGYGDEREMIRYMLKHGSVLEEMQISYQGDKILNKSESLQGICEFSRKFPACKVKLMQILL